MSAQMAPLPAATLQILLSLADGERHGYGILRDVAERTDGRFDLGPATLYTSIKRLLAADLIEECEPPARAISDDARRRYYRLTRRGRSVAIAETRRLETVVAQARARLRLSRDRP
jgi:DNA-binding PadR family transcriptional regulator